MNTNELLRIISEGENDRLELYGGDMPVEIIARHLCAFLNGNGGRLILGVGNDGTILGVPNADSAARAFPSMLSRLITPSALWTVERVDINGRVLLVMEIPEGMDKPYVVGGGIYMRRAGRCIAATREEISRLIAARLRLEQRWERVLMPGADLGDLDAALVRDTARLAIEAGRWEGSATDSEAFLHSLGLIESGAVTNAALLLFGATPARWLPQARIRLLVAPDGKTGDRYAVDQTFEENLLRVAALLPAALSSHVAGVQSRFPEESWRREDRVLYPQAALREGIMNALVHRDYNSGGSVVIEVLPHALRVSNPGVLPGQLKPADLKRVHQSIPRNPDIAHVFFLSRMIEKVGRGTQRIVEACRAAGLREPRWQSAAAATVLTFFAPTEPAGPAGVADLSERHLLILSTIEAHGSLKAPRVAELLDADVTARTVRTDLQYLVGIGRLIRRGRGPNTTYALNSNDAESV
ncbi:MAG: putative DNA binding domain-containing protein [Bacteroidetes bacterium]|nr:putative DNA binding domain-containing protein [Bacteroidota bacterium]